MSIDTQAEENLLNALQQVAYALDEVRKLPRPNEVQRIIRRANEFAAPAGIKVS